MDQLLNKRPHRRYNPLRRSWLLVSPQRTSRPWQGETNKEKPAPGVVHDPTCYLCPGNTRTSGSVNPDYKNVYAFTNDFPALNMDYPFVVSQPVTDSAPSRLMRSEPESGTARVLCFHPNHSLALSKMNADDLTLVIDAWAEETLQLGAVPAINYVQIFENRGAMMGSSLPHPHCQIWATEHVPDEPKLEFEAQLEYLEDHQSCLLCDYLGGLALRDAGPQQVPPRLYARTHCSPAPRPGRAAYPPYDALRQSLPDELSVHDGLPPGPD
jgi:UDPglucose--hexose-1-phosphate uridylyltransferase